MPKPAELAVQCAVDAVLGNQPGIGVGDAGRGVDIAEHAPWKAERPEVYAQFGIEAAGGEYLVEHAQVGEYFQAARLYSFCARAIEGPGGFLDDAPFQAASRQVDSQSAAGRPGPDDQYVDDFSVLHQIVLSFMGVIGCLFAASCVK